MRKAFIVAGSATLAVLLLASFTYAQVDSENKPLGDVAREQKELRKEQQKKEESQEPGTNDNSASGATADLEGPTAASTTQESKPATNADSTDSAKAEQYAGERHVENQSERVASILDRSKDSDPDEILVPAGTELKVDLDAGKTIVPVRVGFATPIPALSHVAIQMSQPAVSVPYFINGTLTPAYVDSTEYATITAVTVGGKSYEVQTNTLPLSQGGTHSELTFVLDEPVSIER